jgi:hypothetical protein
LSSPEDLPNATKPRVAVPEALLCRPRDFDGEKDKAIDIRIQSSPSGAVTIIAEQNPMASADESAR